jgi:hypothetical protein
VSTAVAELTEHAAAQFSGRGSAKEATMTKAVAREALRDDLDAIARTVKVLAIDDPGLADKFTVPRAGVFAEGLSRRPCRRHQSV